MDTHFRQIILSIIAISASVSLGISFYPEPTETQQNLANTSNAVVIAGVTALCSDGDDDEDEKEE
ncbi:hypothetical protein [Roseofilum sp. Guam]|uniref:hypothetical protein n=1 Tax=Roseofilum sp. Guam TaxID=2821502 RepID=UPI001B0CA0A7|nr:hypothetical protein [Roseofilum sp. Guam]MBP0028426.1 hypothetical protein [Roseofilum sp. Guam]